MESTGLPGSIQMSYRVVKYLPDRSKFTIVARGRIAVKGKASCWWCARVCVRDGVRLAHGVGGALVDWHVRLCM
jgi:hypothetical protein